MSLHKRRYDIYSIIQITTYLVRLLTLPEREEELPTEREAPVDMPPEERIELEEDERTVLPLDDERIVLLEEERTALLAERVGATVVDVRTALLDERDGDTVVVVVVRVGCVRVVAVTVEVRVGATPRSTAVCTRVPLTDALRVAVVDVPRTAVVRVAEVLRTLELPKVVLRVACTLPLVVEAALTRVAPEVRVVVPRVAFISRTVVRRLCSKARAFCTLRDALRVSNERSGWRTA